MEAISYYPGSIGEIVQGRFYDKDVLLSCPVNLFTEVRVYESKFPISRFQNLKTDLFLKNVLRNWGYFHEENHLDIEINSQIPKGKGFASSTADLCALYYALLKLFKKEFDQEELIKQCIKIEPTDSIIFKEMTLFEYKSGNYKKGIGSYLPFHMIVFEGEKVVDTIEFNSKVLSPQKNVEDIVPKLISGIKEKDIKKLSEVSTKSIIRNQHRLNYRVLEEVMELCNKTGGLGIIGAHSGDCLGIIFEDKESQMYAERSVNPIVGYKNYCLETLTFAEFDYYSFREHKIMV